VRKTLGGGMDVMVYVSLDVMQGGATGVAVMDVAIALLGVLRPLAVWP